jgi:hypothetical protein
VTASAAVESNKTAATMSDGLVCTSTPVKVTTYCITALSVKLQQYAGLWEVRQQVNGCRKVTDINVWLLRYLQWCGREFHLCEIRCCVRPLNIRTPHCLETSGSDYPLINHHIPEEQNPQPLMSCIIVCLPLNHSCSQPCEPYADEHGFAQQKVATNTAVHLFL